MSYPRSDIPYRPPAIGDAGLTGALSAAGGTCEVHRFHAPRVLTTERHHVIPQAWQEQWSPAGPIAAVNLGPVPGSPGVYAGREVFARRLWDPRTVEVCPTGHRNVHLWMVRLMKAALSDRDPGPARHAALHEAGVRRPTKEFECAYQALERWTAAGGSIFALQNAGQWGWA